MPKPEIMSNTNPIIEHRSLTLYDKLIFENAILRPPYSMPNIMQEEACFLYVRQGKLISYSESESHEVHAREAVLMKCGNFLGRAIEHDASDVYEAVAVHFYPEVLKKIFENEFPEILKNLDRRPPASQFAKVAATDLIHKYVESLLFYFDNPALVSEDLLKLKLKELLLLLANTENADALKSIVQNLFSPVSFEFKEIIESHLYNPLTVDEMAALCNMSTSSFKREFKRLYQASPAKYIRHRRLSKAAEQLTLSDLSVSHIAWDCGFQDLAHFSRLFKKHFGSNPRDYRRTAALSH